MATWKKAVLVILAAIVSGAPVFARRSCVQVEGLITFPEGAELSDAELLSIEGELIIDEDIAFGAFLGMAVGYVTSLTGVPPMLAATLGYLAAMSYWGWQNTQRPADPVLSMLC